MNQYRPPSSDVDHLHSATSDVLAVIATYNERDNLESLVQRCLRLPSPIDVLIVDDNSPDGTGQLAGQLAAIHASVNVLHRPKKAGLGPALTAGFRWAIERGYGVIVNLDGDLSHDPADIPILVTATAANSLVLGSRYVDGIRVVNWPSRRLWLSRSAARYVRSVTGMPIADPTTGFRCFRREALQLALRGDVMSRGYSFHIELAHKVWRAGLPVIEVPITFTNRTRGRTKLDYRIVIEAAWVTWRLRTESFRYPICAEMPSEHRSPTPLSRSPR